MSDYAYLRDHITGAVLGDVVRRASDGAILREDPDGGDWRAYLAWAAAGGVPAPAPDAPAAPMPDLSDRQFARGLWGDDVISYADYIGFIGPGSIPSAIQAILATLPDDDTGTSTPRKEAVGFLTGSKTYLFVHPLVETFRVALVSQDARWTPDYLRQRWLAWAQL